MQLILVSVTWWQFGLVLFCRKIRLHDSKHDMSEMNKHKSLELTCVTCDGIHLSLLQNQTSDFFRQYTHTHLSTFAFLIVGSGTRIEYPWLIFKNLNQANTQENEFLKSSEIYSVFEIAYYPAGVVYGWYTYIVQSMHAVRLFYLAHTKLWFLIYWIPCGRKQQCTNQCMTIRFITRP